MKTLMKKVDDNNVESQVVKTDRGYALIVRDLDADELVTRVNSAELEPLYQRYRKMEPKDGA